MTRVSHNRVYGPRESRLEPWLQVWLPSNAIVYSMATGQPVFCSFPCSPLFPLLSKAFLPYPVLLDKEEFSPVSKIPAHCPFWGRLLLSGSFCFQSIEYVRIEITDYTVLRTWSRQRTMSKISASPADAPHIQMFLNWWENPDKKHCKLKYQELINTRGRGQRWGFCKQDEMWDHKLWCP